MTHFYNTFPALVCLLTGFGVLSAQHDAFLAFNNPQQEPTTSLIYQDNVETTVNGFFYHQKKLPLTYTGIVIELTQTEIPLNRNNPLFRQFGNVYFDRLDKGGYAYCILTEFKKAGKAKKYLNQIISPRVPEVRVIKYQLGRRKRV